MRATYDKLVEFRDSMEVHFDAKCDLLRDEVKNPTWTNEHDRHLLSIECSQIESLLTTIERRLYIIEQKLEGKEVV